MVGFRPRGAHRRLCRRLGHAVATPRRHYVGSQTMDVDATVNLMVDDRRNLLSKMRGLAELELRPYSIKDLEQAALFRPHVRSAYLLQHLATGLARNIFILRNMPFGFASCPSIRAVTNDYISGFAELKEFCEQHSSSSWTGDARAQKELLKVATNIFQRQRGTMMGLAKGILEFKESLEMQFKDDCDLAFLRDELEVLCAIEESLDQFFTNRTTMRLLTAHVAHLSAADEPERRIEGRLGTLNQQTQPVLLLFQAYESASKMCVRDFGMVPDFTINGVPVERYMSSVNAIDGLTLSERMRGFTYVDTHLYYIGFEILKNAMRTSVIVAKEKGLSEAPPVQATFSGDSDWSQPGQRIIKIADQGAGMTRQEIAKAWSYFYSSVQDRPKVAADVTDFDSRAPMAGYGFGLPVSRTLTRYFGGALDLNSIPGTGTDVYVYL
mmetsp:Transcript_6307/g.13240  ORF Transcript_6307/g.13240 Transcript_6307/m.13240 type:complete len:439 (-) Transcript_6307:194-1510(-)